MSRNSWIALVAGLLIACLCLSVCGGAFVVGMVITRSSRQNSVLPRSTLAPVRTRIPLRTTSPTPTPRPIERQPLPTPEPPLSGTSHTTDGDIISIDQIASEVLPEEDLTSLAERYKGVRPQDAVVTCTTMVNDQPVGATRPFVLSNQDKKTTYTVTAALRYETPQVYIWVEQSPVQVNLDQNRLRSAADHFSSDILSTDTRFFGDLKLPGPDCDNHLNILHATGMGTTVAGYYSSSDVYPRSVRSDSNQVKMFVINAEPGYNGSDPGSAAYMSTLAHELQHMISFDRVHAPSLWLEEGAAQLAERLNGYADEVTTVYDFSNDPGTQLTTWSESSAGENSAHYGAGYLFWSYLYDRFGPDTTQKFAQASERSVPSLMKILADAGVTNPDTGKPYEFNDLFADFVIANYMGQQKIDRSDNSNRYNYSSIDVPPLTLYADLGQGDYPYRVHDQVNQFGTQYLQLRGNAPVSIQFTGSTVVPLIPDDSTQGLFWWSNRADSSDSRLTRSVDLTHVDHATLNYRAWYRVEKDFDYAYVSVSTDEGTTWTTLHTGSCTTANPNGANLGCGYTGSSGNTTSPQWVNESVDLSPYAGKTIQLRFEVVTDTGVNREGFAIDNIEIPEIGFKDDVSSNMGWHSEGFERVNNTLPQTWQVQLIVVNQDGSRSVQHLSLANNEGKTTLDFGPSGKVQRAILAISAATPVTTEPGTYELQIR